MIIIVWEEMKITGYLPQTKQLLLLLEKRRDEDNRLLTSEKQIIIIARVEMKITGYTHLRETDYYYS